MPVPNHGTNRAVVCRGACLPWIGLQGQCGVDHFQNVLSATAVPLLASAGVSVSCVAAGMEHSLVATAEGQVLQFGSVPVNAPGGVCVSAVHCGGAVCVARCDAMRVVERAADAKD
jgi:hypothetical protein